MTEIVTERRERAARAQERHQSVRAHIRQRREAKGVEAGGGGDAGIGGGGAARRRNWLPGDLVEDVNAKHGVQTYDASEVEVANQMFCTVKKKTEAEMM